MPRIDALPCPPSRDPRPRSARIPDSVLGHYEAFLERVRGRRQALELTQEGVAKLAGISKAQVANIERGYSIVSVPKLFVLAKVLRTTPGELLGARPRRRSSAGGRRRNRPR